MESPCLSLLLFPLIFFPIVKIVRAYILLIQLSGITIGILIQNFFSGVVAPCFVRRQLGQTFAQLISSNYNLVDERGNKDRAGSFRRCIRGIRSQSDIIRLQERTQIHGELPAAVIKLILYSRTKINLYNSSLRNARPSR